MAAAVVPEDRTRMGVRALARKEIHAARGSRSLDEITDVVLAQLDADARERIVRRGVMEAVRSELAAFRRPERSVDAARGRAEAGRGELDLALISVYAHGEHRWLLDCDAPFLTASAGSDREQAGALVETAGRKEAVAALLTARGRNLVRELPRDLVRDVWLGKVKVGARERGQAAA